MGAGAAIAVQMRAEKAQAAATDHPDHRVILSLGAVNRAGAARGF
jgi:hypothetical protein